MEKVIVQTTVNAPLSKVWEYFTQPQHITLWNFADASWYCPKTENNLIESDSFSYRKF